jgi:uncharacterized protein DUF885
MRLALMLAIGLSAVPAPPEAAGGRYEDLTGLFKEWREFQKPRVVDGVPDYTAAAMAAQRARLPRFQRRLQAIDPSGWPAAQQIDWQLVRAEMNGLDFDHRVLRPWSRHPGFYAVIVPEQSDTPDKEGPAFAGALSVWRYSFPLPASDVALFRTTLRAIPRILDQARTNLTEDARDLWIVGIRRHKEQADLLTGLAKRLEPEHPDLARDAEAARQAEDGFRAWLESKLPQKRGPSGVGIPNYDWYLKNVHLVPHTWRDEVVLHERELGRARAHLALEMQRNRGLPALEPIATAEEWQSRLPKEVAAYVQFLAGKQIVTVKDYMEPALRARIGTFAPAAERDFFAQVEYREPLLLRSHGYHWFDLARMEQEPHQSPIRRVPLLYNIWDTRAEGLATAMEEMMASAGLYDGKPRSRELVYVMIAQRAARGLAGLKMHSNELSLDQAVRFASENTPYGWMKPDGGLVWGEQGLYLEQPAYGSSYLMGKAMIESLLGERARQLGPEFSMRRFMDEMNAVGMIPVPMIRWEMTGERPNPSPPAPARPASSTSRRR